MIASLLLYTILYLASPASTTKTSFASKQLQELLKNYDRKVRPYVDGKPVDVKTQVSIVALGPIDEKTFTFEIDIFFRQWWHDPRINLTGGAVNFNGNPSDLIWLPDLFFLNSRSISMHRSTTESIRTRISYDGEIYLSARIKVVCSCIMDLHYYPMDNQTCSMLLESYSYNGSDLNPIWHEIPVEYSPVDLQVAGYQFENLTIDRYNLFYAINEYFPVLKVSFHVRRTISYYIYRSYIPSTFLVLLTWGTFWLPPTTYPARITLIVTNFLASAFILQGASSQITKVPYTTAIEVFLLVNITFILFVMIEYILVIQIPGSCWTKKCHRKNIELELLAAGECNGKRHEAPSPAKPEVVARPSVHFIDRFARILVPILYVIFLVIYFAYYLFTGHG